MYESLVSGFGRERAISVIEQFLATKEKELVADIDRVKNLLMEPTSDQWAERSLRGEINEAGRSLKRTTEGFRIGDILLGQVFGTKLTESVGHNTETMLQELEAAAEKLSVAVSYEPLGITVGNGGVCRGKGN